jgi:predicted TIM-barrel fold metal-dependent hydrolase
MPEEQESTTTNDFVRQGLGEGDGSRVKPVELPSGPGPLTEGIKIVDCDVHFSEPPDMWTSRAPAALKSKAPYTKRVGDVDLWFMGDDVPAGPLACSVVNKEYGKLQGKISWGTYDDMSPSAWDVKERLAVMDRFGIWAAICYQNTMGVVNPGALMKLGDPDLALWILQTFNDCAAERQAESGNRLFSQALLPIWDREALVKEARRCVEDLKLTGLIMSDEPEKLGLPTYLSDYWAPFWELADHHRTPIDFHLGHGINVFDVPWNGFSYGQRMAVVSMLLYMGNAATLANFIVSGLYDKYTNLRMVSVESGVGWIPFALEAMEYQVDEMMPTKGLQRRPKEYFRDHWSASFWFEEQGPKNMLEQIGIENVLFETDFPHPTSLYPGVQGHIEKVLGDLSAADRKRILQDNAVELYQLPV